MLVNKTVDEYKRKRYLDKLKNQYVIRHKEMKEQELQIKRDDREIRKEDIKQWKQRKNVRSFINDKMKIDYQNDIEPITEPFKLDKQI